MHATVISDDAECDRIWALADRVFAPYATYRREAAEGFFGRLSRQRHVERDPIAGQNAGILRDALQRLYRRPTSDYH
jgi:hypothetical protein